MTKKRDKPQRDPLPNGIEAIELVGLWFHSVKPRQWQARIVAEPKPGLFLVLNYEWGLGQADCFKLLTLDQLTSAELDCSFYQRHEAWRAESEEIIERAGS